MRSRVGFGGTTGRDGRDAGLPSRTGAVALRGHVPNRTVGASRGVRIAVARVLTVTTLVLGAASIPLVALSQPAQAASTSVTDDFNRADGALGPAWTPMGDGGMAISSQVVTGTNATTSGDIRVGETYASDQSSQMEVTATQVGGGQWIGPAVRAQNGGQDLYLGLYWGNGGSPVLMLFKRTAGNWIELGSPYASGPLAAGTQLTLSASGSTLSFAENGVVRISATDTTLTGGAPGIMAYGTAQGDNWVGEGATGTASTYTVGGTHRRAQRHHGPREQRRQRPEHEHQRRLHLRRPPFLTQGSAYNVTVKTGPLRGELSPVTNPSGTIATANVTNVSITCVTKTGNGSVSDNFNRANGSLGVGWTDMSDGGLAISSQVVVGTNKTTYSGDIRTGETYASDQSSQIEVTSTQLSGGQWIREAVRTPKLRPEPVSRSLLLEQRQP